LILFLAGVISANLLFCEVLLMLRALFLALTVLVLPLGSVSADTPPKRDANAALTYWQAFAQLPQFTDAEQKKLYADCGTMPLDARVREILSRAKTEYAFRMMHRAAALPRCDWDMAHEEGIGALAPHAQAARMLSALACLRARLRFEEGKNAEAVDDILAAMTLGRYLSQDGVLILLLLSYGIEQHLIETLALYLPNLDAKTIKILKTRLDALPPGTSPAASMRYEEQFTMDWLARKIKDTKDRESLLNFLGALSARRGDLPEKNRERGREFLQKCGGTPEAMLKVVAEARQAYTLMAKKLVLPLDQFAESYEDAVQKPDGNPVNRLLFPALPKVLVPQIRVQVRRALLSAALAVQLDGKDALKEHPDPLAGGSFEYVAFKDGFELRSKWKLDEKLRSRWKLGKQFEESLTLTVGRR
jgi:hypothetical protein